MVLGLSTGFVALEREQVAGTAMVTCYGADSAAINLVIVDAALRGRGLGRRLMEIALREAGDRSCNLAATPDGMPLYESLGFRCIGEVAQHQGVLRATPPGAGVEWRGPELAAEAAFLDGKATGLDRSRLIQELLQQGRIAALGNDGALAGFAVLRPFGRGEVAGPVVAGTAEEARALLAFVFAARPGRFVRVDTPADSGLGPWLEAHGLARVDTVVAMRRGGHEPDPTSIKTFALASQALG